MTQTHSSLRSSLELYEVKPGLKFDINTLRHIIPDVETALFFGKVYELDYVQLSALLSKLFKTSLVSELFGGDHSTELQDYIIDDLGSAIADVGDYDPGEIAFTPEVAHGEILPQVWESLEVEVATSLKEVAAKLVTVVDRMPGKQGAMVMHSMMKFNAKRPTMGDYKARIHHAPVKENLLILDVSGSMTERTVETIVEDVVAMAYMANAHLAIVSNDTVHWAPGTYDVPSVLAASTYQGTHYETLAPLFSQDWGVVVTVADYDSSPDAKAHLKQVCHGNIDQVLDISLVNRPTYLAECVGQLAQEVRPVLVAGTRRQICI